MEADWLSRLGDRGPMPPTLREVNYEGQQRSPNGSMAMKPPGVEGSPWIQGIPHPNGVYDSL